MNKYIKMAFASACCVLFAQCSDFLETSSPSNTDDEFVTSRRNSEDFVKSLCTLS